MFFDDDGDVLAARPTPLAEVRPLLGVLRHTAAHIVDIVPYVQIPRCACAAVGGPGGGIPAEDRRVGACRAGYRRAQDPAALCVPSSTQGRRVGGSAYDRTLFLFTAADCRADHRLSSSSGSVRSRRRGREGSTRFTPRTEFNSAGRSSAR